MVEDPRVVQARRFLELLFEEALETDPGLKFLVTSIEPLTEEEREGGRKPHIRTRAFSQIDDAALSHVMRQCDEARMDAYVCMGMVRDVPARGRRSSEDDVHAVGALWQDFDVYTPGLSKKDNYPPTLADAERLLNVGPHKPSFRVLSGYGVHGYWRLTEPWVCGDATQRKLLKSASHRFHLTFHDRAAVEGWTLDATFDLVRIMRIPGTLNFKNRDEPRPVELEEPSTEVRYDFDADLEQYLVDEKYSSSREKGKHRWEVSVGWLEVDAARGLPSRVDTALENDEDFKASWHSESRINDRSPSGYDMSCVNYMVQAGLTDQEIADAIAFRRAHVEKRGDRSKGTRLSYVQATIGKVRMDTKPADVIDRLASEQSSAPPIDHDGNVQPDQMADADRERHLEALRSLLKLHVVRYVQVGRDEPQHYLETPDGRLNLGTTSELFKFDMVSSNLWDQHDIALSEDLRKEWKRLVKQVLSPIKEVDSTTEPTKVDKLFVLLQGYVEEARPEPEENLKRAVSSRRPFYKDDDVWVHLQDFKRSLTFNRESSFFRSADEAIYLFKAASEFTPNNGTIYNKGRAFVGDNGRTKRYFPFDVEKVNQGSSGDPNPAPHGEPGGGS